MDAVLLRHYGESLWPRLRLVEESSFLGGPSLLALSALLSPPEVHKFPRNVVIHSSPSGFLSSKQTLLCLPVRVGAFRARLPLHVPLKLPVQILNWQLVRNVASIVKQATSNIGATAKSMLLGRKPSNQVSLSKRSEGSGQLPGRIPDALARPYS